MGTVSKTLCHFSEKLSLFEKSADPHGCRLGFQPLLSETRPAYSTRWRTRFHADGGQCSSVMADSVPR